LKTGILFAVTALSLVVAGPASAATIVGLYNTGADTGGSGWGVGGGVNLNSKGSDAHWYNAAGNGGHAFTGLPLNPSWISNNDKSRWITLKPQGDATYDPTTAGNYTYTLSFNLAADDVAGAFFTGQFLVDNQITSIVLNNTEIFATGGDFDEWTAFSSSPGAFVSGTNTLAFNVLNFAQNGDNPTGLRVEFLTNGVAAVPEPATWAMMIGGFGLIGLAMRRRRNVRTTVTYA
jgi:hypothetical protein